MRGVFEPQAILDQPGFACLGNEFLEDLGEAFGPDPLAKISNHPLQGEDLRLV